MIAAPVLADGLVTCGNDGEQPCTFSDLGGLLKNIINYITTIIVPLLAVIGFVIAGIMMMTSAGDPTKFQKAKQGMIWIVVGVIIVYGAWFIVTSFVTALGGQPWTLQFFGK